MPLFATYIPDSLQINSGIEPVISAKLLIVHNESDQVYYEPTGVNFIKVYTKVGAGGNHFIGFGEAWRDSFQQPITNQPEAAQQYTVYLPYKTDSVSRLDEERRVRPSEMIYIELEWNMIAARTSGATKQSTASHRISYKPDPNKIEVNPQIVVTPNLWFEILKVFGWPDRRLVEIRFSKATGANWEKAAIELQSADNAYEGRQDPNVLLACERAYEAILGTKAVTSPEEVLKQNIEQVLLKSVVDPNKRSTIANMITRVIIYCRRMKHTQPTDPNHPLFDVNSGDAELGLITTKAIIVYLSKL
jgi:hypothetical protein